MPQPLSSTSGPKGFEIGSNTNPLSRRPALAVLAMEAIASWSLVETQLLNLYMTILGGDPTGLAGISYLALEAQSAKTAVIQAAAKAALSYDHFNLLTAILGAAKSLQRRRDKLAHHTWGISISLPDALLLADPRAMLKHFPPVRTERLSLDPLRKSVHFEKTEEALQAVLYDIYVYREEDFNELISANNEMAAHVLSFSFVVAKHIGDEGGAIFRELCSVPGFRERLDRQSQKANAKE